MLHFNYTFKFECGVEFCYLLSLDIVEFKWIVNDVNFEVKAHFGALLN